MATLTYVYSDSTAVLGPLATYAEPHSYDLCEAHAARLTAPRGWEVVRLAVDADGPAAHNQDDLIALVEAVREAARPRPGAGGRRAGDGGATVRRAGRGPADGADGAVGRGAAGGAGAVADRPVREVGRRGHLRVLGPADDGSA